MRRRALVALLLLSCCGGRTVKMEDDSKQNLAAYDGIAWTRRDVLQAGVAIPQHPDWATLDNILGERGVVYQRFGAASGMVFVSYGPDATAEWQVAHTGVGARMTCTIEKDETIEFLGATARHVRIRVHHEPVGGHRRGASGPEALPELGDEIFVVIGFLRRGTPVLVGYRLSQSELATFEALLQRILAGVRPL